MHEADAVLAGELDRLAAGPMSAPDWTDVVRRGRPARTRRHVLIAVPLVFLAIALPAVALSAGLRSALGAHSSPAFSAHFEEIWAVLRGELTEL